jgi:hypothetical protein
LGKLAIGQSWIEVELDLSPPTVDIYAPTVVYAQSLETISIEANEALDTKQSIYIIDSLGVKHDYTFYLENENKRLYNFISFGNYPNGLATLFVTVYDEVLNKSSIYSKTINVGNVDIGEGEGGETDGEITTDPKLYIDIVEKQNELIFKESIAEIKVKLY